MNTKILKPGTLGLYKYVVIITEVNENLILCKRKNKTTWEFPSGNIDSKENPLDAAKRVLREQTGAVNFTVKPLFDCWSADENGENGGTFFHAQVTGLGSLPDLEIDKLRRFEKLPKNPSYPEFYACIMEEFYRLRRLGKV